MAGEDPSREGSKIESLGNVQNVIGEQLGNLSGLLDGGINIASDIIRSSTATAKTEVEKAAGLAKVCNHTPIMKFTGFIIKSAQVIDAWPIVTHSAGILPTCSNKYRCS